MCNRTEESPRSPDARPPLPAGDNPVVSRSRPRQGTLGGRLRSRAAVGLATFLMAGLATGCSSDDTDETAEVEEPITGPVEVPVPPADGPKLIALESEVLVRDRPALDGVVLGTLYLGARVARAEKPYTTRGCAGGWYAIRPRGFVCVGEAATIDESHPVASLAGVGPDLEAALPYRYARVWAEAAVTYGDFPSQEEQLQAEPKLSKLKTPKSERIGAGAIDVPLDEAGLPTGLPVVRPDAPGVGEDGYRTSGQWLVAHPQAVEVGFTVTGGKETRVVKRRSSMALLASTEGDRPMAVTATGRFVPIDRLEPVLGSTFHGKLLKKLDDLPVAFTIRAGVDGYELGKNATAKRIDEEYAARERIDLTGRYRTVNKQRYWFTKSGHWMRHKDLIVVLNRTKFPDFATGDQKWIDISLANQTLVAWEGRKPILATLISSGRDRLGDPNEGPSTIQGVFNLRDKAILRDVDGKEVGLKYELFDAPWVMSFADGFALTGCTWHNRFGEALGHHDVALSPVDAHFLWKWSSPAVPEGWNSVKLASDSEDGTIVYVHK